MRLGQQPPDLAVGIGTVPGRAAEQPGDLQDPLVVGDDVADPAPQHGIGKPCGVTGVR